MENVIVQSSAIPETAAASYPNSQPEPELDTANQVTYKFPRLETVTRPTAPTDAAAYYLNRQPQTLRAWACLENGPIRPIRINGRLAWSVADIKRLLNGGQ